MCNWSHQVSLGHYPEEHFSEEIPLKVIKDFQGELQVLSAAIKARNKSLEVPYTYMDPEEVENSVAIWISDVEPSSAVGKTQSHIYKYDNGRNCMFASHTVVFDRGMLICDFYTVYLISLWF